MSTRKNSSSLPTTGSIKKYVDRNAPKVRNAMQSHHDHHGAASLREAEYKGHKIQIRTTYQVTIDGRPVTGHLGVTDDGTVHYHPVPNKAFTSAVDLVRALIDIFPDDFPPAGKGGKKRPRRDSGHAGHTGHH
jgi:hypothetical protein